MVGAVQHHPLSVRDDRSDEIFRQRLEDVVVRAGDEPRYATREPCVVSVGNRVWGGKDDLAAAIDRGEAGVGDDHLASVRDEHLIEGVVETVVAEELAPNGLREPGRAALPRLGVCRSQPRRGARPQSRARVDQGRVRRWPGRSRPALRPGRRAPKQSCVSDDETATLASRAVSPGTLPCSLRAPAAPLRALGSGLITSK